MKEINISQGYVALVDDDDYERLSRYKWFARPRPDGRVYVYSRFEAMHRVVMERELANATIPDPFVDHINHNCLDNRKENLRVISNSANQHNRRKPIKGVTFHKHTKKFMARISVDGKRIQLGYFDTEEEAVAARNRARILYGV